MAISCLLQHRACAGLALLVLAAPLLRAGAAEPSRPLEETGQSVGSVANASDHSLQTNRANGEQPSGVELDLPSVSSEWPLLGRAVVLMPVLGLMWFCGVAYYRFFSGGTKGKRKVPLAEAAGAESTIKVFLDIQVGDAKPGRVELLLFAEHYPRTAENFRALCTGELGKRSGYRLHYKGSRFHRIIPGFMCQGGNCTGSQSIYGGRFADEWASGYVEHSKAGLLSMANAGRDTNTAQFFITCRACHHLDGRPRRRSSKDDLCLVGWMESDAECRPKDAGVNAGGEHDGHATLLGTEPVRYRTSTVANGIKDVLRCLWWFPGDHGQTDWMKPLSVNLQ